MQYIAALDYAHMDNGMFLTALAQALVQQKNTRPIIIHSDSVYTDRIMQTGVMREEAQIRSMKDLNHRLVALFADQGISTIGMNAYQRKFITLKDGVLTLDQDFFEQLPAKSVLLLSSLVWDLHAEVIRPVPLTQMTQFLHRQLATDAIFSFLTSDSDEIIQTEHPAELEWGHLPANFADHYLPDEFHQFNRPLYLSTARDFRHIPDIQKAIFIH